MLEVSVMGLFLACVCSPLRVVSDLSKRDRKEQGVASPSRFAFQEGGEKRESFFGRDDSLLVGSSCSFLHTPLEREVHVVASFE